MATADAQTMSAGYEPRVLIVIDRVEDIGGAEGSTALILTGLHHHGIQFDAVSLDGIELRSRERLESTGARFFEPSSNRLVHQVGCTLRAIRIRKPDLIHATLARSELVARIAGLIAGVPVMTSIVSMPYSSEARSVAVSGPKLEIYRRVDAVMSRHATFAFHAITEASADAACDALGIARDQVKVVTRGRDRALLGRNTAARRARAREMLALTTDQPVILNVARQDFQKGQHHLVEALGTIVRTHPDAMLIVAGREGSATSPLRAQVARLGLDGNVRFLGVRADVPDLLCAADVFAFPSLYEGLGGALLEALALGVPIVAFDIAPVREAVDQTAVLVPARDSPALAEGIVNLLEHPERAAVLARDGRLRFEDRFTNDRYLDAMRRLYVTTTESAAASYRPSMFAVMSTRRRAQMRTAAARVVSPAPVRNTLRRLTRAGRMPNSVVPHLPLTGTIPIRLLDGPEFEMESAPQNLVVRRLFFSGEEGEEPETLRAFAELVDRARWFVDVGANQGIFTLMGATRNPELRVLAFEPNPRLHDLLRTNLALNQLADRVELSRAAVSDAPGTVQFEVPDSPFATHGRLASLGADAATTVEAEAVRLDDVVGSRPVDLIKIDVEGAESLVLEGARATLDRWHPSLIIEVLEGRDNAGVDDLLRSLHYDFFWLTGDGPLPREGLVPDPTRRERNYLCLPRARSTDRR
jgi:FkbM family methyltransferase